MKYSIKSSMSDYHLYATNSSFTTWQWIMVSEKKEMNKCLQLEQLVSKGQMKGITRAKEVKIKYLGE